MPVCGAQQDGVRVRVPGARPEQHRVRPGFMAFFVGPVAIQLVVVFLGVPPDDSQAGLWEMESTSAEQTGLPKDEFTK